jgi:hypothetical protein
VADADVLRNPLLETTPGGTNVGAQLTAGTRIGVYHRRPHQGGANIFEFEKRRDGVVVDGDQVELNLGVEFSY